MANRTKTNVVACLLGSAGLLGACAHQADAELLETEIDSRPSSEGSARGGAGGGSAVITPNAPAGKGGSTAGSTGQGGSTASAGAAGGSDEVGGSGGSDDVGGGEPAPDTGFSVLYMASQTEDTSVAISCQLKIRNDSAETVPLGEFTLRYYFTDELTLKPDLSMWWAQRVGGGNFNVELTQEKLSTPAPQADHYFEFNIADDAPTLAPGEEAELSWQSFNGMGQLNVQTNDYSFDATKTQYAEWEHVVLLRNGEPYWGAPP